MSTRNFNSVASWPNFWPIFKCGACKCQFAGLARKFSKICYSKEASGSWLTLVSLNRSSFSLLHLDILIWLVQQKNRFVAEVHSKIANEIFEVKLLNCKIYIFETKFTLHVTQSLLNRFFKLACQFWANPVWQLLNNWQEPEKWPKILYVHHN